MAREHEGNEMSDFSSSEEALDINGTVPLGDLSPLPEHLGDKIAEPSRLQLQTLLGEDEKVLYLELPVFMQTSGFVFILSCLGTLALLICAIFFTQAVGFNTYLTLCVFPLVGMGCLYTLYRRKYSYVAFTNKRVVVTPTFGPQYSVAFKEIVQVDIETNYLQCRKEIKITKEGKPKVHFIEGVPTIEKYVEFLNDQRPEVPVIPEHLEPAEIHLQ